jgi:hypothetical protein
MAEMRRRSNEHNVTWLYANQCWTALMSDLPLPPIPKYQIYEVADGIGKGEVLIKELPITPCQITCRGKTYFGRA